jgi:DNA-binding transcriptional regulator GbsR (MarR family)
MIGKSEFRFLSVLMEISASEVAVSDLAEQLEWSLGHTSKVVSDLETRGCVRTRKHEGRKLVAPAEIEPIEELEALLAEFGHVDFPELVAGAALQLCYYLDRPRTATELTELSGVSRATVYRRLDDLQTVGIVGKSGSRYQLNDPFSTLSGIARGLAHHEHRREAKQHTTGVRIVWETHDEYLLACDDEIDAEEFHLTGPARFADFDIPLLTRDRRHYLRSDRNRAVSPAELVSHMLLIDDSSRYRTYCLLVIVGEGIESEALRECARRYDSEADFDLIAAVDELVEYLETEGDIEANGLPTWKEFKSTAADYEISV